MAENILGLVLLLISQLYILNIRNSVLKNESTVSMSAEDIALKSCLRIRAALD